MREPDVQPNRIIQSERKRCPRRQFRRPRWRFTRRVTREVDRGDEAAWQARRTRSRGGSRCPLGEAISLFSGAEGSSRPFSGVVAAVAPLIEPAAWRRAVDDVRQPLAGEAGVARWVSDERIFRAALGSSTP